MDKQRFRGKTAIVTGAAGGIGKNIASRLARDGARLILSDLNEEALNKAAAEITLTPDAEVWIHTGDLSNEQTANELVRLAMDRTGSVDILVNNAGGGVIMPFLEHTPVTLKATIDRNLWTTLWCCRAVLPYMIKQNYGRIVNIGADSVRNGLARHAGYNAAKGGVHGLTTGLAREFSPNKITVNTVAPCATNTEGYRAKLEAAQSEEQIAYMRRLVEGTIPMGRPAEMEEISSAVAYLASEEASFITGQVISVNGGSTML